MNFPFKTPKGYSTFYKNPANNFENDLRIFEGFVDTDNYSNLAVNFPCFWTGTKKGVFTIERGTPICQLLIMKREQIDFAIEHQSLEENSRRRSILEATNVDGYRDRFWHKSKERKEDV